MDKHVGAPQTAEEVERYFSEGLNALEKVAGQLQPFGANYEAPHIDGPPLRIRPYAISWSLEYRETNGRWVSRAWGKTGAEKPVKLPSKIMSLMTANNNNKRDNNDVPHVAVEATTPKSKKVCSEGRTFPVVL